MEGELEMEDELGKEGELEMEGEEEVCCETCSSAGEYDADSYELPWVLVTLTPLTVMRDKVKVQPYTLQTCWCTQSGMIWCASQHTNDFGLPMHASGLCVVLPTTRNESSDACEWIMCGVANDKECIFRCMRMEGGMLPTTRDKSNTCSASWAPVVCEIWPENHRVFDKGAVFADQCLLRCRVR
jgi:hypothetical protein